MKRLLIAACVVIAFAACNRSKSDTIEQKAEASGLSAAGASAAPVANAPKVKFEKEIFDFGQITQGEKVHYEFKFKNEGKTPLIITNASATCGCTQPEYPSEPVKPGEEGTIKVTFNSEGKMGMQDKVVTIISNANPDIPKLHLVGEVKARP
ncbi:DUF1573 domain-containing protein [Pedobacter sp. ASV12]|uniref:DUF1573 domain-containing protein n=1 Tax=Pedobacter sp. ASV12 TaxID=2795120 RepID=UPI0018EA7855|nr:DUF1573 domain-containing protein [Pedobacter sp. ASV12]